MSRSVQGLSEDQQDAVTTPLPLPNDVTPGWMMLVIRTVFGAVPFLSNSKATDPEGLLETLPPGEPYV